MSSATLARLEIYHKTNGLRYLFLSLPLFGSFALLLDISAATVSWLTCPKNELLFVLGIFSVSKMWCGCQSSWPQSIPVALLPFFPVSQRIILLDAIYCKSTQSKNNYFFKMHTYINIYRYIHKSSLHALLGFSTWWWRAGMILIECRFCQVIVIFSGFLD